MSINKYLFRLSTDEKFVVGDYNNGNYLVISDDGTLELVGDATTWDDLRIPITQTKLGGSKDPGFAKILDNGSGSQGVFAVLFDKATEEEVYTAIQLPHNWREGSSIRAHFHWSPTDTDTGDVVWGIEYSWASIGETFGNTTLTTVTDTASGTADDHLMTSAIVIDGTGQGSSSMIMCRLYRDAANEADTYDADAALLEFDVHYEVSSLGEDALPAGA